MSLPARLCCPTSENPVNTKFAEFTFHALGVSLRENIDTTTPGGKLVFHVFGAVAEFERDLILERTMAGLEAARARGRKGGRKPAMDEGKIALASKLMRDRETPVSAVCEAVGVSRATLYRYVGPHGTPRAR